MRAIKKNSKDKGIILTTSKIPKCNADEILIKVRTAGICGTDLHIFKWDNWSQGRVKPPLIIGHEFAGEIVKVGSNVKHLKEGQRVTAEGHITCGVCRYCRCGQQHICKDVKIIGVDRDCCFADYLSVPASYVWQINENISDRHAVLFDPLGNAMHTVMAQPVAMKNILITGSGSIGLFAVLISKVIGAAKVIVVEPCTYKRELAVKVGADYILDPDEKDVKNKILEITNGFGPDVFLEMSGDTGAINLGLDLLSNGGSASLLGIPSDDISLKLSEKVIFKGITIKGITGRRFFETWFQCENFLINYGKLTDPIITHSFDMENIGAAFSLMEKNNMGKVLLNIN